jgi:hypothetical protein
LLPLASCRGSAANTGRWDAPANAQGEPTGSPSAVSRDQRSVNLSDSRLASVKVERAMDGILMITYYNGAHRGTTDPVEAMFQAAA